MTVSNICILGTIAVYLVGMLIIGFRCARKNESSADFYLGGRKLGPLVTAMSAEASDMSSYLLMGLPGLAYLSGVADVGWTAIGLAVGTYLNWLFTALRLRRYTQETGSFTIPQFFSRRFRDDKNILAKEQFFKLWLFLKSHAHKACCSDRKRIAYKNNDQNRKSNYDHSHHYNGYKRNHNSRKCFLKFFAVLKIL